MILVTGFGPFLKHQVNPTELLILDLEKSGQHRESVETLILPVSFENAFGQLQARCESYRKANGENYSVLLLMGLASGRRKISLERVGLNWCESEHPDNRGFHPQRGPIDSVNENVYFTSLQPESLATKLTRAGVPVEVSLSAGGYVCNHLYFKALSELSAIPSLFVHFPDLPIQLEDSLHRPTLDFEVMKQGLSCLIENIVQMYDR